LALAAVGIPMILIIYDSILCPLIKAMLTVRSCSSLRTTVVEFVASIPGCVLRGGLERAAHCRVRDIA
jgi:hypothetical protein